MADVKLRSLSLNEELLLQSGTGLVCVMNNCTTVAQVCTCMSRLSNKDTIY